MNGHNVGELISVLNPVIRGIAEYWKPLCSSKAFSNIDSYIWMKINKFLKRLHPNKSKKWIVSKYFPTPNKQSQIKGKWILTDPISGNQLRKMHWTEIERHVMIKNNYSPLDKSKSAYFKKRYFSTTNRYR